ncbi:MAG: hypothetical protein M1497_09440, partial [Nitrospirae bacterium]|nr:hypothetical protein [Nitrospirota bacterium]
GDCKKRGILYKSGLMTLTNQTLKCFLFSKALTYSSPPRSGLVLRSETNGFVGPVRLSVIR